MKFMNVFDGTFGCISISISLSTYISAHILVLFVQGGRGKKLKFKIRPNLTSEALN